MTRVRGSLSAIFQRQAHGRNGFLSLKVPGYLTHQGELGGLSLGALDSTRTSGLTNSCKAKHQHTFRTHAHVTETSARSLLCRHRIYTFNMVRSPGSMAFEAFTNSNRDCRRPRKSSPTPAMMT
jgi:hypothetical protein